MIDARLSDEFRQRLVECQADWRNAYAGPLQGKACVVFPEDLARRCEQPPLRGVGLATLASPLEPLRREPAHRSELLSEVRGGEWLTLLFEDGEWCLVQCEDGYVGWMARWSLLHQRSGEREQQRARLLGHYARPLGTLWDSDSWASASLCLGTPLLRSDEEIGERGGRHLVALPWGAEGWLGEDEIDWAGRDRERGATSLLRRATMLLGTPYRWGGRSAASLDCSGYVQLVFEREGMRLPRDAAQQSASGRALALEENAWEAGDLLLFGEPADHVGIYDGRGALLHCRGFVRRQGLGEIPELVARLSAARRIQPKAEEPTLWLDPRP
jgi:cell wall-associated NlpC family hydrolase